MAQGSQFYAEAFSPHGIQGNSAPFLHYQIPGSMLGILCTFGGMGFLIFMKTGSFFLPRVMFAKISSLSDSKPDPLREECKRGVEVTGLGMCGAPSFEQYCWPDIATAL